MATKNTNTTTLTNDVYIASHLSRGIVFKMPDGQKLVIKGVNDSLRGKEKGILIVGEGVITKVDKSAWEYISKTYANFAAIKNGLIYVSESYDKAKAQIKEKKDLKNGFEPIDPTKTRTQKAEA